MITVAIPNSCLRQKRALLVIHDEDLSEYKHNFCGLSVGWDLLAGFLGYEGKCFFRIIGSWFGLGTLN